MKLNLRKFKNFGKGNKNSFSKNRGEIINPLRDWSIGLGIATLIFFLGIAATAFDFYSQFYITPYDSNLSEEPLVYRANEVKIYAEIYDEKEKTFNQLRLDKPPPLPEKIDENIEVDIETEDSENLDAENKDEPLAEDTIDE